MAKRQDIHSIISEQDEEQKKRVYSKLQQRLAKDETETAQSNQNVLVKKAFWIKRNIIAISFAFALIILSILIPLLLHNKPDNGVRYCSISDYYLEDSEFNIGQYSAMHGKDMLSFDYENKYEYLNCMQYKLNTTNEVICLAEELIANDYIVNLYITDDLTEVDFLSSYDEVCIQKTQINSVEISCGVEHNYSYAKFKYEAYIYYLKAVDISDNDYVLALATELINTAK